MSSQPDQPTTPTQADIDEITEIFSKIYQNYEETNTIDDDLKDQFYSKLRLIPVGHKIIIEFEKILAKITKDESDKNETKNQGGPLRIKRQAAPLNPQFETEKKQTCIELFADFGSFFNKSISKVGLKYCSESEIVRRSDILTGYNAATNQLGSGQQ
jgi:hypothetical protein